MTLSETQPVGDVVPPGRRSPILFCLKATVSVALLAVLFAQTDLRSLSSALQRASLLGLLAALALYLLMILASAWRWNLLLAAQQVTVSAHALVSSLLVATFFNSFLPSNIGGDVVRIRDTSRLAGSIGRATMIVVVDRAMGLLGLLLVAAVAATLAGLTSSSSVALVRPLVLWLAFGLTGGGLAGLVLAPRVLAAVVRRTGLTADERITRRLHGAIEMLLAFRTRPVVLAICFGGAVLAQAILVAFYVAIAWSLAIPISILHLAVLVPISFVVQLLPVSVNGFGVREATFTYYFTALNLPIESALILSLLGAGLILLFSLSGGVLYVARR